MTGVQTCALPIFIGSEMAYERRENVMKWEQRELFEEIFDKAMVGSEYMKQVEDEIVKKLEGVLSIYKERLDEQEFGILQEIVIGGVVIAEKEAFIAGVYYGIQLLR